MKILFQGDSITDADRDKNNYHNMGYGYPKYASEAIINRHPGTDFEFINLGLAGHRVEHLRDRWQKDCIDIQPDVVSILIGVNDIFHFAWDHIITSLEAYEENYRYLLTEIKEKTNAKIIIMEQFLLPVPNDNFTRIDLDPKLQITRKLAREFADILIPLDGIFAAACVEEAPTFWAADGVHPTEAGARLIARHYADAFDKIFLSIK
ncbi:MAG: GDSL family lipase [Ruminococcaceae bacterium]|nr:GDSL family lipase [Oscillospiraceae bacterium]